MEDMDMTIEQISIEDPKVWNFIGNAFSDFARKKGITLNFEEYCYVAKNDSGGIIGAINGRAYYNEVHIGDLIVDEACRGTNVGTELVRTVEKAYSNRGYEKTTLTTFGFQAPGFYEKLGYSLEFVREDKDPRLRKYFFCKNI